MALAIVQAMCWQRSGNEWFALAACATIGIMIFRVSVARRYNRRSTGTPVAWARYFVWTGLVTSASWGVTGYVAMHCLSDPMLQMIAITVEAGWVSGMSVRNSASPAAVFYQSLFSLLPPAIGDFMSHDQLQQLAGGFFLFQLLANVSVAGSLGKRMLNLLLSEQEVAEANAKLSQACGELEDANVRLQRLSHTDGLTGIGNRRAFDTELAGAWTAAGHDGHALSLVLLDVDFFKSYNDLYGHPAGDDCLRTIAEILGSTIRQKLDFAGRFGGEEFVVLLPGTDLPAASLIADRLRQEIAAAGIVHKGSPVGIVTVSAGVSCASPHPSTASDTLVTAADKALYQAKQNGRNRVVTNRVARPIAA